MTNPTVIDPKAPESQQDIPDGTALLPNEVPLILHWFAQAYMKLFGWKVIGYVPNVPKMIVVAGPHTANRDGVMLIMTAWILRVRLDWMVKAELVKGPWGWVLKKMGAVPIDRSRKNDRVKQAVENFLHRDKMLLVIAPEGTRKKTDHWKTGFYRIAMKADVPLFLARLDYKRKVIDLTDALFYPTGDIQADVEYIWDVYRPVTARFPEKVSDMRLRPRDIREHAGADTETEADDD